MVFLDWKELPWHWSELRPVLVVRCCWSWRCRGCSRSCSAIFAFRSRVKGVYFSIITQALTFAAMLLFFRNDTGFGGNNGFTDFKRILGFPITTPETRMALFVITGAALLGTLLLARYIVTSRLGRVLTAIRDAEARVMFCGYNTLHYKLFVWTLSAVLCGIAGALYVPQVGIINPSEMSPANSIEIAIWVAVGGRGTLVGADPRRRARERREELLHRRRCPEYWLYVLGLLFILVTLFLPQGVRRACFDAAKRRVGMNDARVDRKRDAPGVELGRRARSAGTSPRRELDAVARRRPLPRRHHGQLRRLQGAEQPVARRSTSGELRCVIGPNGAGKTTMMDVITGKTRPGRGHARSSARRIDLTRLTEAEIAHAGIGRKFQKPTIFEHHSVFENLELAMKADKRVRRTLFAQLDRARSATASPRC